jgi:hypothetical protein
MVWEPAKGLVEICAILVPFGLLPLLSLLLIRPLVRAQEQGLFKDKPAGISGATDGHGAQPA